NFCKEKAIPVFDQNFTDKASIVIGFHKSVCTDNLKSALREYSQMDFEGVEEYGKYLGMEIEFTYDDEII
ncbi:MAG: hypothetical protein ABIQ11_07105, partial [Saprospiraceae bacterium]